MGGQAKSSFRDLKVRQKGCDLVAATYLTTRDFPGTEVFGLTSQMNRCAASIPANIAEGKARGTDPHFLRHLRIAAGSMAELETFLEIAGRLGYSTPEALAELGEAADEVGKMLHGRINRLEAARGRS